MNAEILDQLITMALAHQAADEYVSGTYWNSAQNHGCAVGCSIADLKKLGHLKEVRYDDHASLADATGVPEMLWRLSDDVFEGLPSEERSAWTPRFLKALRTSTRVETAPAMIMSRLAEKLASEAIREDVRRCATTISSLWLRRANGDDPSEDEWNAAWEQAYAAWEQANAARKQANAAREQANAARKQANAARKQANAAWEQANAAWEQANAARKQAYAALRQFWLWCADMIIEVLS